jgi:hypothetical protein
MKATLQFSLPDDQGEFDRARLGPLAISTLWDIDQHLRSLVKHGEPTPDQRRLAETIRNMIPAELLDV